MGSFAAAHGLSGSVIGMAVILASCGSSSEQATPAAAKAAGRDKPAAERPSSLLTSEDFHLRVHDFDWEIQGSTVYALDAAGRFTHVYPTVNGNMVEWRERTTQLNSDEVEALRQLLVESEFVSLDPSYRRPGIEDGAIATFWLRSGGHSMRVRCQNELPAAAARTLRWLEETASRLDGDYRVLGNDEVPGLDWDGAPSEEHETHE